MTYYIFHITPSSCQLLVQLDIDIFTRFKVSLFTVYIWIIVNILQYIFTYFYMYGKTALIVEQPGGENFLVDKLFGAHKLVA